MAPELREHKSESRSMFNAYKADVYCLGVCLFVLLFKTFPNLKEIDVNKAKIEDNIFTITNERWASKSKLARHLVRRMLE